MESGLYKVDNITKLSPAKSKVTLLDEEGQSVIIETEETENSKNYIFRENGLVTEITFSDDNIYVNDIPVTVSVNTKTFDNDSGISPHVTSENWKSDTKPFDSGTYSSKVTMVKDINIQANQTIGSLALTSLLALVGGPVASGLSTLVVDISTFSGLKNALKALQKEAPGANKIYQRESYYKSSQQDISHRPYTYYYKVKIQYAKTQEFASFYPQGATYYRKQMIYA